MRNAQWFKLNMRFLNVEHLIYHRIDSVKTLSKIPLNDSVKNVLIYMINQYFPLGIPHLNLIENAENILKELGMRITSQDQERALTDQELTLLSNKYYSVILQRGSANQRKIIDSIDYLRSKEYIVREMRSIISSLRDDQDLQINPIDFFFKIGWIVVCVNLIETLNSFKVLLLH